MEYSIFINKLNMLGNADLAIDAMQAAIREPAAPGTAMARTFLYGLRRHHTNRTLPNAADLADVYQLLDADMRSRIYAVLLRAPYSPSYGL